MPGKTEHNGAENNDQSRCGYEEGPHGDPATSGPMLLNSGQLLAQRCHGSRIHVSEEKSSTDSMGVVDLLLPWRGQQAVVLDVRAPDSCRCPPLSAGESSTYHPSSVVSACNKAIQRTEAEG